MSEESHATWTFGRFQPPTESGHGKLVSAVQSHAESTGGKHYIFPSHSQDKKKNPLSHSDKVGAMKKLFPKANVVSHESVRSPIDAMRHLEKQGHTHVTMVVGSDRVGEMHKLLHAYNGKEYNFKKINVKSAGNRDPDAEGAEGMSASKMRGLVSAGKRDEFVSHYSNKKLGAEIHDKVKKAMTESVKALFILGAPGSGKDYVINNILNRFNLVEVQLDQILNGAAKELLESGKNLLINSTSNIEKIQLVKSMLGENYEFSHTLVSVTNKISQMRNRERFNPMNESTRLQKWIEAESAITTFNNIFIFNNSVNLREATEEELNVFQSQIENYLEYLIGNGFIFEETNQDFVDLKPMLKAKQLGKKRKLVPPDALHASVGAASDGVGLNAMGAMPSSPYGLSQEEKDPRLVRAGVKGFNKPKRTPGHPTKSHVVVAKSGDQVKTIRFGQQGVSGSPKKEGESESYRKRRESFKARHAKNIAKGKMSAAYWANKEKW